MYTMHVLSLIKTLVHTHSTKKGYVVFNYATVASGLQLYLGSISIYYNPTSRVKYQLHLLLDPIFTSIEQIPIYYSISRIELVPHALQCHMNGYYNFITCTRLPDTQFKTF